ncbi:MAG: hypothetical protein ABIQ16_08370 [Polyangiaceae bacterium]
MSFVTLRWFQRAALAAWAMPILAATPGCQTDRSSRSDGTAGARPMDGLERYTRRTVSLETAIDAIEQRDVKKLKMLSVYVRHRDKTVLFSEDDLASLDLAIECLEGAKSQEERTSALAEIKSGTLKKAAQDACVEPQE